MATVEDYTSGRIVTQAAKALVILQSGTDSLAGSEEGHLLMAHVRPFQPRLLEMTEAAQRIQAAHQCAVGPRTCYPNNPDEEFTEAVFLDELAEGMVAAGKAKTVSKEKAMETLAKYKKNPLVLSTVAEKPMELCPSSPETCICWNMEKRGLACLAKK